MRVGRHKASEEFGELEVLRLSRRHAVIASAITIGARLAAPLTVAAQDASPEADPEPDPEADPEAGEALGAFTLYSGRNETLVAPLIERYAAETDEEVGVRYGGTGELAATLIEEGESTPAAAFFAQDAGALGLLAAEGRFQELPEDLLDLVDPRFRDPEGRWVGITGRARVLAYNVNALSEDELPASVHDLTEPLWAGRIGWAPENASFQAFVTAFILLEGEDAAKAWLEAMIANGAVNFAGSNTAIVEAVGRGEIDAGLVNNYYAYVVGKEQGEDFPVGNHYFAAGDPGALINVAGIGVIIGAEETEEALALVRYLLSKPAQEYFAENTFEYPLLTGVPAPAGQPALAEIGHPDIDLSDLADLRGTLDLLVEVGLI